VLLIVIKRDAQQEEEEEGDNMGNRSDDVGTLKGALLKRLC